MKSSEIKSKKSLQPRLRFPEFVGDGDWEEKKLGEICDYSNGLSYENSVTEKGDYYLISLNSIDINGKLKPDMKRLSNTDNSLQKDDLIMVLSDVAHGNFLGLVDIIPNDRFVLNQRMARLRIKESDLADVRFLRTFINSNQKYFKANGQGSSQLNLSKSSVTDFAVLFPLISEQQKIADCLSSLDELIEAEDQKIEALQRHKKGLMQELFPFDGQTLPKRRFPEFQSAPEWSGKPLIELLLSQPEYGVNAPAVPFSPDLPAYLRITDISEDGQFLSKNKTSVAIKVTDQHYLADGDIALARTGASVGKSYKFRSEDGRLVFAGFLIRVRPNPSKLNSTFLFNFFSTKQYWKWVAITSARSGQPGINGSEYASLVVPVPALKEEQQRIADFLSSVDDLITSQTKKLESLRLHKKGLMQQLFPNASEAENHNINTNNQNQ